MPDVEIGAKVSVDTGNSGSALENLKSKLSGAGKELKNTNDTSKEATSSFAALKDRVTAAVPGLEGASKAGATFNTVLNLIRANPIIAVITALVLICKGLYDAFASTYEGGKKVEQIFAGIKAVAQVVQDRLVTLAGAVVKLFQGDFKGAMNEAKSSVTGLGDEVKRVYTQTAELTKKLQDIEKQERESNVDEAQRKKRLALLREQLNDETISVKEKKKIALELKKDVDENYADDLRRDREKARIKIELLKQQKDGERKNADEIAQIQIDLYNAETANALEGVRVNKQVRAIENQEKQAAAEADKARAQKSKEAKQKAAEEEKQIKENQKAFDDKLRKLQGDNELLAINDENQRKLRQLDLQLKEERRLIDEDYQARKITLGQKIKLLSEAATNNGLQEAALRAQIAKENLAAEQKANEQRTADGLAHATQFTAGLKALSEAQIEQSKVEAEAKIQHQQTVVNTLTSLSSLIGEQTVVGKGLAAAAALINTYQGATKALAQGGIFGYIGAAGVIASGLASVKKILSTPVPGKGSSSGGVSVSSAATAAPVAPPAPTAATTTLDSGSIQGIGNATNKSFVVERDITNNQERVKMLNRQARIG